jgi:hypothetical protein
LSFGEDHKKAIEKNPYRQIESSVFFRDTGFQQFENDRWHQLQKIILRHQQLYALPFWLVCCRDGDSVFVEERE